MSNRSRHDADPNHRTDAEDLLPKAAPPETLSRALLLYLTGLVATLTGLATALVTPATPIGATLFAPTAIPVELLRTVAAAVLVVTSLPAIYGYVVAYSHGWGALPPMTEASGVTPSLILVTELVIVGTLVGIGLSLDVSITPLEAAILSSLAAGVVCCEWARRTARSA